MMGAVILLSATSTMHPYFSLQVSRAEALLHNLEQERDRWSLSSESFTKQLQSLIGDGLLAAAFITYVGVFDYRTRRVRYCGSITCRRHGDGARECGLRASS